MTEVEAAYGDGYGGTDSLPLTPALLRSADHVRVRSDSSPIPSGRRDTPSTEGAMQRPGGEETF